ncbi:MAG: VanZ family protein [Lentimicrobium sp.]
MPINKTSASRILFWLYIGAIFLLVTLPINSAGELNNVTILRFRGDYFFHALLFMPWAFFQPAMCFRTWQWLAMGLLFACGSEGVQYLLPYRAYNVNDLVSNGLGVVLGSLVYWIFLVRRV